MEDNLLRKLRFSATVAVSVTLIALSGILTSATAQKRGKTAEPAVESKDLAERVQQLESQLIEMRVVIDTMASLSQRGPASGPLPAGDGFAGAPRGDARIDVLETQMRAMTSQMEQLASEVRALSSGQPAAAGSPRPSGSWQTRMPQPQVPAGGAWQPQPQMPEVRGFDSRTGGASGGDANRSYLQAINLYNQDDFQGARDALTTFVQSHPNHPQLPTAQYRLGQANFKLGQYAEAAKQFWAIVRQYPNEPVAPDSFAMFAASLGKSGRTKDACDAYQQYRARYPNDARHMPTEARTEQSRLRC